ncbi:MAG: hypothetical protein U5M23_13135 [Marinagarivorans sp.]|nr:hypothetical protein [Marinagarivorans sp.]
MANMAHGVKALATSADARAQVTQGLADTYSGVARGDASAIGQWTGFFGQVGTGGVSTLGGKQVLSATASAAAKTVNAAKAVASTGATASVTVARGIVAGGNQLGKMAESVVGKAKQAAVSWSDATSSALAPNSILGWNIRYQRQKQKEMWLLNSRGAVTEP